MQSAKNETYQKGVVDKAVDPKLIKAAFHEQAGNEAYHEAMLGRSLFTQIELLKTIFADYLVPDGFAVQDATIDSSESNGVTEILLNVSDRFNDGYVKTLARLSQKFVEDRMIHLWWLSVSKEFAAIYATAADEDRIGILACFNKTAPTAPAYHFPTAIEIRYPILRSRNDIPAFLSSATPADSSAGSVPVETLYNNPFIIGLGDDTEISYTLSGENGKMPLDDIIVRADDPCCRPYIGTDGKWHVKGESIGYTIVTLFSRHNDKVFNAFAVRVAT